MIDLSPTACASRFASVETLIDAASNGRISILVDNAHPGATGQFIQPAQLATPDAIDFMAQHGRGLISLALDEERAGRLGLSLLPQTSAKRRRDSSVSIAARTGVMTGISVADRALPIAVAGQSDQSQEDLVPPGTSFRRSQPTVACSFGQATSRPRSIS